MTGNVTIIAGSRASTPSPRHSRRWKSIRVTVQHELWHTLRRMNVLRFHHPPRWNYTPPKKLYFVNIQKYTHPPFPKKYTRETNTLFLQTKSFLKFSLLDNFAQQANKSEKNENFCLLRKFYAREQLVSYISIVYEKFVTRCFIIFHYVI